MKPLFKQSGSLKIPPRIYENILSLLKDQLEAEKSKRKVGLAIPLAYLPKGEVTHTIPMDLQDFEYISKDVTQNFVQRKLIKQRNQVFDRLEATILSDPKMTKEILEDFKRQLPQLRKNFISRWGNLKVSFVSTLEGQALGTYSYRENKIKLWVEFPFTKLSLLEKTIAHELKHMVQFMMSDFHKNVEKNFRDGVVTFGLPKRKARTPEFEQEEDVTDSYYLSDLEFHTLLGDVKVHLKGIFKKLESLLGGELDLEFQKDTFYYLVGMDHLIKDPDTVVLLRHYKIKPNKDDEKFLKTLQRYAKKSPAIREKFKLAMKEITKVFS